MSQRWRNRGEASTHENRATYHSYHCDWISSCRLFIVFVLFLFVFKGVEKVDGGAGISGPRRDNVVALPIGLLVLPMGRVVRSI